MELIFSLFFAFETRKIRVKELNDSKMIVFSVYSIVLAVIAITPIMFLLSDKVNIVYGIVGAVCLSTCTALLGFNFIPKVSIQYSATLMLEFYIHIFAFYCFYCKHCS